MNKAALDHVVQVPLGLWLAHQAWRKNVSGIVKGPLPFFCVSQQNGLTLARMPPCSTTSSGGSSRPSR
jgi:hypothetical protein